MSSENKSKETLDYARKQAETISILAAAVGAKVSYRGGTWWHVEWNGAWRIPPAYLVDAPASYIFTRAYSTRKTCEAVPKLLPPELIVSEVVPLRLRVPTTIGPLYA
jgi:hypothetical protein